MVHPTRPTTDGRINPIAWIEEPKDRAPRGVVYKVPDERLFYVPLKDFSGKFQVNEAIHLTSTTLNNSAKQKFDLTYPLSVLGAFGKKAEPEIQKWLLVAHYGKENAARLAPTFGLV